MKKIVIIGAGGNSKVIIDIVLARSKMGEELQLIGILDDDKAKTSLKGLPILGKVDMIKTLQAESDVYYINGIGDNYIRKSIFDKYGTIQYYTAIHPSAIIGSGVTLEAGCIVMAGAIINADARIGKQALINTGAIIEHDNHIGDFAHIASGAATAGNVFVGECSMLGTGAKVIQGITIGSNVMIGAGAVVIRDIEDHVTAAGVPARIIKRDKPHGQ